MFLSRLAYKSEFLSKFANVLSIERIKLPKRIFFRRAARESGPSVFNNTKKKHFFMIGFDIHFTWCASRRLEKERTICRIYPQRWDGWMRECPHRLLGWSEPWYKTHDNLGNTQTRTRYQILIHLLMSFFGEYHFFIFQDTIQFLGLGYKKIVMWVSLIFISILYLNTPLSFKIIYKTIF